MAWPSPGWKHGEGGVRLGVTATLAGGKAGAGGLRHPPPRHPGLAWSCRSPGLVLVSFPSAVSASSPALSLSPPSAALFGCCRGWRRARRWQRAEIVTATPAQAEASARSPRLRRGEAGAARGLGTAAALGLSRAPAGEGSSAWRGQTRCASRVRGRRFGPARKSLRPVQQTRSWKQGCKSKPTSRSLPLLPCGFCLWFCFWPLRCPQSGSRSGAEPAGGPGCYRGRIFLKGPA